MYQLPETSHTIPLFSYKIFSWDMLIEQFLCCLNVTDNVFKRDKNKNSTETEFICTRDTL